MFQTYFKPRLICVCLRDALHLLIIFKTLESKQQELNRAFDQGRLWEAGGGLK